MTATIVPCLQYADAPAAIDWLVRAFGFTAGLVVQGEEAGTIAHAQLHFRDGCIMLGTARDGIHRLQPPGADGVPNQSIYVVIEDADALFVRAVAAGATIVMDLRDTDYGSRDFTCRDPEGHVWNFGTYAPDLPG